MNTEFCMSCGNEHPQKTMNYGHCPDCQTDEKIMRFRCDNGISHEQTARFADILKGKKVTNEN